MTRAPDQRARNVVRALQRELNRQVREGTLLSVQPIDQNGGVVVEGRIDLAMLALVTEEALLVHFGLGAVSAGVLP